MSLKYISIVFVAVLGVGCSSLSSRIHSRLGEHEAATIALEVANREAEVQFGVRPFKEVGGVVRRGDTWIVNARQGVGAGDLHARVTVRGDGRDVQVDLAQMSNLIIREF